MAGMIIGAIVKHATGSAIAGFIASYAVDALISSQQDGPETFGPRLQDTKVQSGTEGAAIKRVYGTDRIAGNIIWTAGIKETSHTQSTGGGKGGGGGAGSHTTYTYSCSFAVGLCEGPIVGIARIWADNVLIYSNTDLSTSDEVVVSDSLGMTEYLGSEGQAVSPLIEAVEGVGDTPAFRGLAYVTFTDLQLEKFGNRVPNLTCEVAVEGGISPLQIGVDTLPSIITKLCAEVGVTDIDVAGLSTEVKGFTRTSPMPVRAALNPLVTAYNLSVTESDYKIVFTYKDGQPDIVIDESELAATESKDLPDKIHITRTQGTELPRRVEVVYSDFNGDYQQGNQFAQRVKT